MLLHYFGEKDIADCGQCDVCVKKRKERASKPAPSLTLKERVIALLSQTPCPAIEVAKKLDADREEVDELLASLISEEIIQTNEGILSI
jgi:ATP-dependent DNA helicase RecQ